MLLQSEIDPGPFMFYVSRMIPASDKGSFFAFGWIFYGKIFTGGRMDLYVMSVQRTVIWIRKKHLRVEDVPCGNIMAPVDPYLFIFKNAYINK